MRLAAANIPHNVFISDGGQRAWLLPNAFAASKANQCISEAMLDTQVCLASCQPCAVVLACDLHPSLLMRLLGECCKLTFMRISVQHLPPNQCKQGMLLPRTISNAEMLWCRWTLQASR